MSCACCGVETKPRLARFWSTWRTVGPCGATRSSRSWAFSSARVPYTNEKGERSHTCRSSSNVEARQSALSHILRRFFDNSRELLVLDLLGARTNQYGGAPAGARALRQALAARRLYDAQTETSMTPS